MDDKYTRQNLKAFYEPIQMPGGYYFNQPETLKFAELYLNSQFESGPKDSQGFLKFFFQVIKPACDVASKFIDLDTKDVLAIASGGSSITNEIIVWVLQRDLKQWLKDTEFGVLLNDMGDIYPSIGHVVIKRSGKGWKNVPIVNLRVDAAVDTLEEMSHVYEILTMSAGAIKDMPWDKVAVKTLLEENCASYVIYECYDYNLEDGKKWRRTFKARMLREKNGKESPESAINNQGEYQPALVLHADYVDKLPYREFRWEKVTGRWLGRGIAEYLRPNQQSRNELVNIKRKGLYWTSLKLYQTRDETVGKNLMTDAENGDVIKAGAEITPIANEERNLAVFNQEETSWDSNSEKKTFTFDIARGGNLPSQTPLGVANLSAGMVTSYFEKKREVFGLFIKKLLFEDVIPDFKASSAREHSLTVLGSDAEIDKLDELIATTEIFKASWDYALRTGYLPSQQQIEDNKSRVISELKRGKNRELKLPEGIYDNAKYFIDILITNEQIDTGARIQTYQMLLQLLSTNPGVVVNPLTRGLVFKLMEMAGVSPIDLGILQQSLASASPEQMQQMMASMGGSIGAPQGPGTGAKVMSGKML